MRLSRFISLAALAATACCPAQVNILPKEDGATAVATSSRESCAIEKAQQQAEEYCKTGGKHYVAVKQDSVYQGADPNAKLAVGVITGYRGDTSQDYKVTIDFKCE